MPTLFPFKNRFTSSPSDITHSIQQTTRHRRAIAWLLLVVFFVTFLPMEPLGQWFQSAHGQTISPTIDEITIEKTDRVVEGQKTSTFRVIFNGFRVNDITTIQILRTDDSVIRTIGTANFIRIDDTNMAAENIGSLSTFFGETNADVKFRLYFDNTSDIQGTIFRIPSTNLPDIERIHDGDDWVDPIAWPATIRNEADKTLRFYGNNLTQLKDPGVSDPAADYALYFVRNNEPIAVTYDTRRFPTDDDFEVFIPMGGANIPVGNNMAIRFEKPREANVRVHYIVEQGLNIIRPLNLGTVDMAPMEGTQGTLLRIRAGVGSTNIELSDNLVREGTRVFVGGALAPRNIVEVEGLTGIFEYQENVGGEILTKRGLEVIVPFLENPGPKQVLIQNAQGDTYVHGQTFTYFEADTPRLFVLNVNPDEGPIDVRNRIDLITVNNLMTLDNLRGIADNDGVRVLMERTFEPTYPDFEAEANNPNLVFLRYVINPGEDETYVERRISLTVGLPAQILTMAGTSYDGTLANLTKETDMSARTDRVSTVGPVPVRVRTETVHLDQDGNLLNFIAEQAPAGPEDTKVYTFYRDDDSPTITGIVPASGPYDKNIIATVTGTNFNVRFTEGNRYLPTVIIGKDGRFKVINQHGMFLSDSADGTYDPEKRVIPSGEPDDLFPYQPIQVLDAAGNVVDGQLRTVGTQIKLTIPRDLVNDYYTGAADVYVRNPTADGNLGSIGVRQNIFEYLPKPDTPITITSVTPNRVAVGARDTITVRGTNFQSTMQVTIDGQVIPNPQINTATGTITFQAPVGRPGQTWLQVLNTVNGAHASYPFEFVRSDSQPLITSITPNIGGRGTLVIIKGNNYFVPQETADNEADQIGTIVQFQEKDVNKTYFRDNDGDLELREFVDPFTNEPILNAAGEPIMTYGSHVAVVDSQTIYLIVPDPRDVTHSFTMNTPLNVTVLNPDLGKAVRAGGFTILNILDAQRPVIDDINPKLGDYRGGNIVEISGSNISDGARVYFGSQQATVFRRSSTGSWIRVFVPAYAGQLINNRAFVPVTVQNRDNSSDTKYNGYEYVNPGYTPVIERIVENSGNTAGGERVLIHGQDFRATIDPDTGEVDYPEVYFAGVKVPSEFVTFPVTNPDADDVAVSNILVVEETPANPAGGADVTVINYDGATATLRNGFNYIARQVAITNILPNTGNVNGGDQITITGRGFVERGLHVVFGNEQASADTLSGFGNVQLGDVYVRYEPNDGGRITFYYQQLNDANQMDVYPVGSLAGENTASATHRLNDEETRFFIIPWQETVGENDDKALWADEGVKVTLRNNQLTVTRRLGLITSVEGETRIRLVTPPASQIGQVPLTVYNADGVNASGNFTYTSPFRPPVITNLIPVTQNLQPDTPGMPEVIDLATAAPRGGSPLIIQGRNFRAGVRVYIDNVQATVTSRSLNDDELIVTVPAAAAGTVGQYLRILVINEDGGMAYGDLVPEDQTRNPYYFRYLVEGSNPVITSVEPNRGPVTGGTKVTIRGTDFRGEDSAGNPRDIQVFIGGFPVPQQNVTFIDDKTLEVTVAAGRVGAQTVEILNYDNGRALAPVMYTYVSQPNIATMDPARIFANDANTDVVVTGEMFQNGARVILGGRLVPVGSEPAGETNHGTGMRGVTGDGVNQQYSVVGGIAATTVNVTNEGLMNLRFPEALDLPNNDLIIINPDGGLSDPYADFDYAIPVPDAPLVLEAVPGAEGSVMLIWSKSAPEVLNAADRYEIYGKRSNESQYTYIGDVRDAQFLVRGLLLDTRYDFMVRALNRYGSAIEFAEVSTRTLSARQDPKLGEKIDELDRQQDVLETQGKEEVVGNRVIRTVGSREIPSGTTPYLIDFSAAKYSRQNEFVVAFPVTALSSMNRSVRITDGKGSLTITPSHLLTREVSGLTAAQRSDAVVQVVFKRVEGAEATGLVSAISRTQSRASAPYSVAFGLQAGRTSQSLARLLGNAALMINHDTGLYPNASGTSLMVYDPSSHRFNSVGSIATFRDPGTYMLLGSR